MSPLLAPPGRLSRRKRELTKRRDPLLSVSFGLTRTLQAPEHARPVSHFCYLRFKKLSRWSRLRRPPSITRSAALSPVWRRAVPCSVGTSRQTTDLGWFRSALVVLTTSHKKQIYATRRLGLLGDGAATCNTLALAGFALAGWVRPVQERTVTFLRERSKKIDIFAAYI